MAATWSLGSALKGMFARKTIDDETWVELEDALISADFGPDLTDAIVDELRAKVARFRTTDPAEYFVAGRRVPALYNGMAAGADWMSAASFLGMAGSLYLAGYGGLAFVLGWTGGFCLVALLLAPYLRRFGGFTVPDFLGARFESRGLRVMGAAAAVLVSFIYLVAQIYAIGLITTRLTGLTFEIGLFVGLGGVLVCSFLGGMRAVTWTQVAQYIIMIVALSLIHIPSPRDTERSRMPSSA